MVDQKNNIKTKLFCLKKSPVKICLLVKGIFEKNVLLHKIASDYPTDRGKKCMDPEGNGVTMSEGAEGGPCPPSGE